MTSPGFFALCPSLPNPTIVWPFRCHCCMQAASRARIDVVHTHSPFLMGGSTRAARRLKLPLVFTYHTVYEEYVHYSPVARGLAKRLMRMISRRYCNDCDTVIVPTQAIRDLLDRYGVQTEVVVNPTGIDLSRYERLDRGFLRQKLGIPADHRILLFVGRLGKEKNVHFLIRAFSRIAQEDDRVTLVMVGGGPERVDLEQLARSLGMEQKVVFAGAMQPGDMPTVYAGGDIFVFTSTTDTQGMVITEAMAAGLPVVAVKAYGSGNVVDHGINGLLTSVDEAEFAAAVVALLRDASLFSRLALGTRQKAEEMSSTRCAKRLEQVYLSAVEKKARVQRRQNASNGGLSSCDQA